MKFDTEKNLKAIIAFANRRKELKGKKVHDIYGQLYKYNSNELKKTFYNDYIPSYLFPFKKEDILSEITGSWFRKNKI